MFGAMDLGVADHRQRTCREQTTQIAIALLADTAELVLAPTRALLRKSPIQAEKSRPDRKTFGSATLATRAVASAGPMPGMSSSRLLVAFERCQAMIWRSNSRIWAFSILSSAPRAATTPTRHARQAFVTTISDDIEQLLNTMAPNA